MKDIPVNDVQVDEVWGYVFCKEKKRVDDYNEKDGIGDGKAAGRLPFTTSGSRRRSSAMATTACLGHSCCGDPWWVVAVATLLVRG